MTVIGWLIIFLLSIDQSENLLIRRLGRRHQTTTTTTTTAGLRDVDENTPTTYRPPFSPLIWNIGHNDIQPISDVTEISQSDGETEAEIYNAKRSNSRHSFSTQKRPKQLTNSYAISQQMPSIRVVRMQRINSYSDGANSAQNARAVNSAMVNPARKHREPMSKAAESRGEHPSERRHHGNSDLARRRAKFRQFVFSSERPRIPLPTESRSQSFLVDRVGQVPYESSVSPEDKTQSTQPTPEVHSSNLGQRLAGGSLERILLRDSDKNDNDVIDDKAEVEDSIPSHLSEDTVEIDSASALDDPVQAHDERHRGKAEESTSLISATNVSSEENRVKTRLTLGHGRRRLYHHRPRLFRARTQPVDAPEHTEIASTSAPNSRTGQSTNEGNSGNEHKSGETASLPPHSVGEFDQTPEDSGRAVAIIDTSQAVLPPESTVTFNGDDKERKESASRLAHRLTGRRSKLSSSRLANRNGNVRHHHHRESPHSTRERSHRVGPDFHQQRANGSTTNSDSTESIAAVVDVKISQPEDTIAIHTSFDSVNSDNATIRDGRQNQTAGGSVNSGDDGGEHKVQIDSRKILNAFRQKLQQSRQLRPADDGGAFAPFDDESADRRFTILNRKLPDKNRKYPRRLTGYSLESKSPLVRTNWRPAIRDIAHSGSSEQAKILEGNTDHGQSRDVNKSISHSLHSSRIGVWREAGTSEQKITASPQNLSESHSPKSPSNSIVESSIASTITDRRAVLPEPSLRSFQVASSDHTADSLAHSRHDTPSTNITSITNSSTGDYFSRQTSYLRDSPSDGGDSQRPAYTKADSVQNSLSKHNASRNSSHNTPEYEKGRSSRLYHALLHRIPVDNATLPPSALSQQRSNIRRHSSLGETIPGIGEDLANQSTLSSPSDPPGLMERARSIIRQSLLRSASRQTPTVSKQTVDTSAYNNTEQNEDGNRTRLNLNQTDRSRDFVLDEPETTTHLPTKPDRTHAVRSLVERLKGLKLRTSVQTTITGPVAPDTTSKYEPVGDPNGRSGRRRHNGTSIRELERNSTMVDVIRADSNSANITDSGSRSTVECVSPNCRNDMDNRTTSGPREENNSSAGLSVTGNSVSISTGSAEDGVEGQNATRIADTVAMSLEPVSSTSAYSSLLQTTSITHTDQLTLAPGDVESIYMDNSGANEWKDIGDLETIVTDLTQELTARSSVGRTESRSNHSTATDLNAQQAGQVVPAAVDAHEITQHLLVSGNAAPSMGVSINRTLSSVFADSKNKGEADSRQQQPTQEHSTLGARDKYEVLAYSTVTPRYRHPDRLFKGKTFLLASGRQELVAVRSLTTLLSVLVCFL